MSTTQIKDGYNGGSDNQLKVNTDGSINTSGSSTVTGNVTVSGTVSTNINGLANFKTTPYTVGVSAVQLANPALTGRSSMSFKAVCTGVNSIFIGNSSGVTTSNGWPLFNGDTLELDLNSTQAVWAIASAASQTLYVLEMG